MYCNCEFLRVLLFKFYYKLCLVRKDILASFSRWHDGESEIDRLLFSRTDIGSIPEEKIIFWSMDFGQRKRSLGSVNDQEVESALTNLNKKKFTSHVKIVSRHSLESDSA